MVLHVVTLAALLALAISFRSMQNRNKEILKTFKAIKDIRRREDDNCHVASADRNLRTKHRISSTHGSSSSDDSGILIDSGYAHILGTRMPPTQPPDPPPFFHRNNSYLNPEEQYQTNGLQNEKHKLFKELNSGYEQLPNARDDTEIPHNYEDLKQAFEGETKSNINYEKLVGPRRESLKHDYKTLRRDNLALQNVADMNTEANSRTQNQLSSEVEDERF